MKLLGGREQIPIINVFRFRDGKIVEIWNHRHDIDTGRANFIFVKGLLIGMLPSLALFGYAWSAMLHPPATDVGFPLTGGRFLVIHGGTNPMLNDNNTETPAHARRTCFC